MRVFLVAVLIIWGIQSYAIDNKFNYLSVEQGLTQGSVQSIFQDRTGFLWIGTANGLNRFDGYEVVKFIHDEEDSLSLAHNSINAINQDSLGRLWLGTFDGGLSIYNQKKNYFSNFPTLTFKGDTFVFDEITKIVNADNNRMWVMDRLYGIFLLNKNFKVEHAFSPFSDITAKIPEGEMYAMTMGPNNQLWFAIGNHTLGAYNHATNDLKFYSPKDQLGYSGSVISSMHSSKDGTIWLGTLNDGILLFNPENESFSRFQQNETKFLNSNRIMTFAENDENLFIGTDGGGINVLEKSTGNITHVTYEPSNLQSLNSDAVYDIFIDRSETIWVGTFSGGVNYHSRYQYKFKNFKPNPLNTNSLSNRNVTALLEDNEGSIWIGTDGGGLNHFHPETEDFTHYQADPNKPNWIRTNIIIHLFQDSEGDIFISSFNGGLHVFDKETNTFTQYLPDEDDSTSISGMHPWYTYEDSYGVVWVGMLIDGLNVFDKESGKFIKHYNQNPDDPNALNSPNVDYIFEDSRRRLWFGTLGGGLHLYNREQDNFKRYVHLADDSTTISDNTIYVIYEDNNGYLWIGTELGLNRFDPQNGTFTSYYIEDGLPSNSIYGILQDQNGFLWISTAKGISKFDPKVETFRNFDVTDGLQGNEFNYTASIKSSNGNMYFGGKKGFNVFDPQEISTNPHVPNIALVDFRIFNESYSTFETKYKGEQQQITIPFINNLKLSYKQNVINFTFTSLDFSNPEKNQFKYMLEGFDNQWIETTAENRSVTYTNLEGGNYVFRVIGSNGDTKWNEEGLALNLKIIPPFWKTTWFIILVSIAIGALIYLFIKLREKQLKHDKMVLENKIKSSMKEIEKQQSEIEIKNKELEEKIELEKFHKWSADGHMRISEALNTNKDTVSQLSNTFLTELLKYLELEQGALYATGHADNEDPYLELVAVYAMGESRDKNLKIQMNEGMVGTCYADNEVITMSELPKGYAKFSSGLGSTELNNLLLIPIRLNDQIYGVIELLSNSLFEEYKIEFIQKISETYASILNILKASEKTQILLEKQKEQSEEMAANEEELRQNLEEMKAIEEDAQRQKEKLNKLTEEHQEKEEQYKSEIAQLQETIRNLENS